MTTIREWVHSLDTVPGYSKRRVYNGIRKQMSENQSKFGAKWWDTVVTETAWKIMLLEAIE